MRATEIGYDAGKYWADRGEGEEAMKYRQAFAAYVQGMDMKEIADSMGINYNTLRSKAQPSMDDWPSARQQLILARVEHRVALVDKVEQSIARIKENREKHLASALKLHGVLVDIVTKLSEGTLKVEKAFNTKMGIVIQEMNPSTGDLVNIATFARTVADLTYRALGDAPADSKQTAASASAANSAAPPGITVILPAVAVHPRPRRQQKAKVESVIDLESLEKPEVLRSAGEEAGPSARASTTEAHPGTVSEPEAGDWVKAAQAKPSTGYAVAQPPPEA